MVINVSNNPAKQNTKTDLFLSLEWQLRKTNKLIWGKVVANCELDM